MTDVLAEPTATTPIRDVAHDQELIVQHLAARVRQQLNGRAPEMALLNQRPSQLLQLGVLPPLPTPGEDSGMTPEQLAREWGKPPSHLGFTFTLRPDPGIAAVSFELRSDFLFYVQRYPTLDDQRAAQGLDEGGGENSQDNEEGNPGTSGQHSGTVPVVERFERVHIDSGRLPVTLDLTKMRDRLTIPLDDVIDPVLRPVLDDLCTAYPFTLVGQRINAAALDGDEESWRLSLAEAEVPGVRGESPHATPKAAIEIDWRRQPDGAIRVRCVLQNKTLEPRDPGKRRKDKTPTMWRELSFFDSRLRAYEAGEPFAATFFREAPRGFRYDKLRTVEVTSTNCTARRLDHEEDPERPLSTDTFPLYRQARVDQNENEQVRMRFDELRGDDALTVLGRIEQAMADYEAAWRRTIAEWQNEGTRDDVEQALFDFQERDVKLFARGLRCLRDDEQLLAAFQAANEVFHRIDQAKPEGRRFGTWRLFQVVFQVCELGALRVREAPGEHDLRAQLDVCDVLHFSTGGGKTEAYLGLILIDLFYARLRGKKRGVSAVLRFPLRMLSVQQLARILDVLWWGERYRQELIERGASIADGDYTGDQFLLGYWVGRGNTPNSLTDTRENNERDNITWWAGSSADDLREERMVTLCPNPTCGGDIELVADVDEVRLRHFCRKCGEDLPLVMTDDEVYRYLPSVLVATVDKLAHLARAPELAGMFAGPAYYCPKHGYFQNHQLVFGDGRGVKDDDRCLAGRYCTVDAAEYQLVGPTHDPAPELHIQDELHLLEEELGSLDAHYETLFELLATELGSGLPPKAIAASATVESVEGQVLHLYARDARVFPSSGWELGESFYVHTTPAARRLYFGALPFRADPAEFGERVQRYLHEEVIRMQDDPAGALAQLKASGLTPECDKAWLSKQLQHYELSLGYVNRKQDADRIGSRIRYATFGAAEERLDVETLVADYTTLASISAVLNRIEEQYDREPDRTRRLRALVATSIVSHGVDLNALNLMVLNGMTPSVAGYVQSSSRSGRTHVGLVIVGFNARKARERSFYEYFLKYHEFLDRLITPVPVNRFAKFSARWTVPGVMSALLLIAYQNERAQRLGLDAAKPRKTLAYAPELRGWLGGAEEPSPGKDDHIRARVHRAVGLGKHIHEDDGTSRPLFDPVWEESLGEAIDAAFSSQMGRLKEEGGKSTTSERFRPGVLASFRSVDLPMEFAAYGESQRIEHDLAARRIGAGRPAISTDPED
jgi:Helicase conserved C-terminal domain